MPMTLWPGDGFHLRVRDGRVLLLRPSPGGADPFGAEVEDGWLREVHSVAAERVPALAGVALDRTRSWAGLYEMSPDGHALLGRAPGCENLILANGSSGHGGNPRPPVPPAARGRGDRRFFVHCGMKHDVKL